MYITFKEQKANPSNHLSKEELSDGHNTSPVSLTKHRMRFITKEMH